MIHQPPQTITSEGPPSWKSNVLSTTSTIKTDPDFWTNRNRLLLLCLGDQRTQFDGKQDALGQIPCKRKWILIQKGSDLDKCMVIEQFPHHFIVLRQTTKEVTDALAVGYGAGKRYWIFYSGQKHSPHFPLPARSQKEQQGEIASSQSPHAFVWHRPPLSGTTLRRIQTWIFKSQFKHLFHNNCLQLGIFVLNWWYFLHWPH